MPGTLLEKTVCETCGTEVRDGSAFCYNCGESIVPEPPPPAILKPASRSINGRERNSGAISDPEPAPIVMPRRDPFEVPPTVRKPTGIATPRRTRLVRKASKPLEVEWVEASGSSAAFVVGAAVLALIVAGLVVLAIYLK